MKRIVAVSLFTFCLFLRACSSNDQVADELIDYYNNDWQALQEMKQEKIGTKRDDLYSFDKIENPEEGLDYLENEVLPELDAIMEYLKEIKPKTKEVRELHQLQIDAEEFGYQMILEDGNAYYHNEITDEEIWNNVDKLKDLYDEFAKRRNELMEKYDIVFEEGTNENGEPIQVMKRAKDN